MHCGIRRNASPDSTMNASETNSLGVVASLHLHPAEPGAPLKQVAAIEALEARGIRDDCRYLDKRSRDTGQPSRRQVSLIEREQLAEHAAALRMTEIAPGAARSNVETTGVNLISLLGREIEIGEAVLFLYAHRDPCAKMDAICQGLRERMTNQHQGVLAEVRRSGKIRVGDPIRLRP